jgi:hypothetical protein
MRVTWPARLAGVLLALGALLPLAAPGAALAHERRAVGPYTFVVGFATEPTLLGQPNGATVRISKTADGAPVEGADKSLKIQIAAGGGQPKEFPLRAVFGQAGLYQADLIPTKAGSYIFTFTGAVEGTTVNEKFESGPGRFDDVKDTASLQFPDVVPAPAQMAGTVKAAQDQAQAAEARASAAESQVGQARAFGIAGTIVGLIGLGLAAYALAATRRSNGAVPAPASAGRRPASA